MLKKDVGRRALSGTNLPITSRVILHCFYPFSDHSLCHLKGGDGDRVMVVVLLVMVVAVIHATAIEKKKRKSPIEKKIQREPSTHCYSGVMIQVYTR